VGDDLGTVTGVGGEQKVSALEDRADRQERARIRDLCLKKAVVQANGLDDITDAAAFNRAVALINALSNLSLAITARDA
jgi:hypothetical protein